VKKVLVAYSTWAGTTHQVANEIEKELSKNELQVNVMKAKSVRSVVEYEAVILGTSIHAGQMTGDFNRFLNRFHKDLAVKNSCFFVVCFNMIEDNEKNNMETLGWLNKSLSKYPEIKPVSLGLFAGAALTDSEEFNNLNILVKKLIESMKKSMDTDKGKSDFRELDKIHSWAADVALKIA
jgi:menaquinone-dependent protoporphyrinogen oxidase